jgi:hypothetical protein
MGNAPAQPDFSLDQIMQMARRLTPLEKLKLIEKLAPDLEPALASSGNDLPPDLDDQYQRGYEQIPEDISDLDALMPHLPVSTERWE